VRDGALELLATLFAQLSSGLAAKVKPGRYTWLKAARGAVPDPACTLVGLKDSLYRKLTT
jgi:hypothetical protein